jgi:hypothetical protein
MPLLFGKLKRHVLERLSRLCHGRVRPPVLATLNLSLGGGHLLLGLVHRGPHLRLGLIGVRTWMRLCCIGSGSRLSRLFRCRDDNLGRSIQGLCGRFLGLMRCRLVCLERIRLGRLHGPCGLVAFACGPRQRRLDRSRTNLLGHGPELFFQIGCLLLKSTLRRFLLSRRSGIILSQLSDDFKQLALLLCQSARLLALIRIGQRLSGLAAGRRRLFALRAHQPGDMHLLVSWGFAAQGLRESLKLTLRFLLRGGDILGSAVLQIVQCMLQGLCGCLASSLLLGCIHLTQHVGYVRLTPSRLL